MPWRLGGLTTRGRCLLAAGVAAGLCAILVDERDLLRVAAFVIALPLLASVVVGRTQIRLHAERELVPPRVAAGGDCQVHLTLRGSGRLGGRLLLEDMVPDVLGGSQRAVVAQLPQSQAVQLSYPMRPMERRVHSLGPLVARITDPLGLAEYKRTLAGHSRLVVIPAVAPLTGIISGGEQGTGEAGGERVGIGQSQDAIVVRSYRQGDDLRKVHWRTSARRDELMVRVEEWSERGGATVLLDNRTAAHRGNGAASSLEYAVSLAASVYVHLRQRGQRVRLVSADGQVQASGTEHTVETALDLLAALRPTEARELASGSAMASGQEVVAVLGAIDPATDPGAIDQLLAHRPRSLRSHALLLDVAAWATGGHGVQPPDPARPAQLLAAAGWSVTVARPEQSPLAVWDQLCRSPGSRLKVPR